jgi:hypothetical protein
MDALSRDRSGPIRFHWFTNLSDDRLSLPSIYWPPHLCHGAGVGA